MMNRLPHRESTRAWLVIGLLAALTYHNSLGGSYHFDDSHSIVDNPHIRSLENIPRFFVDPTAFSVMPEGAMYRPLLLVSYAMNFAVGGYDVTHYHLINLLLHIANSGLVYLLAIRLVGCGRTALICGILFTVHPILSEPVNYISSRSSLLCTLFFVFAFLELLKLTYSESGRWPRVRVLALFACALFSKSIAVSFPLVAALFLLITRPSYRPWGTVITTAVFDVVYVLWSQGLIAKAMLEPVRSLMTHWVTQLKVFPFYAAISAVPARLSVEHQFSAASRVGDPAALLGLLALVSVVALTWRVRARFPVAAFGVAWGLIAILPSAVVPLNVLVNEHRLYLPMVGAVLAVGALWRIPGRTPIIVAVVAAFALLTFQRNPVWETEATLWADAVRKGPHMARPYVNLGKALLEEPGGQRLQESIDISRKALMINPALPRAHYNIGTAYLRGGDRELAVASFERALRGDGRLMEAQMNLGVALKELGRYAEAQTAFRRALAIADFAEVHHNLGSSFLAALQPDSAAVHFRAALNRDPEKRVAYEGLAKSLRFEGRNRNEAVEVLSLALAKWPRDTELLLLKGDVQAEIGSEEHAAQAYRTANLDEVEVRLRLGSGARKRGAWVAARQHYEAASHHAGSDPRIFNVLGEVHLFEGNIQQALASFRRAARLDPKFVSAYVNIGLANLKHGGRTREAIAALERAVELSPQSGKTWGLLGWAYDTQGDGEAAIPAYTRGIELAPEHAEQYHRLAMIYQTRGVWGEAERLYKAALARNGGLVQTQFNLGFVYLEQGRFKEAVAQNEKVLTLRPDHVDAYLNLASAWIGLSATERAGTAYARVLELMDGADPRRSSVITQLRSLNPDIAEQGVDRSTPSAP